MTDSCSSVSPAWSPAWSPARLVSCVPSLEKRASWTISVAASLLFVVVPQVHAETHSVGVGDDIQAVIDGAASGDRIEFSAGDYPGMSLDLGDKTLDLVGAVAPDGTPQTRLIGTSAAPIVSVLGSETAGLRLENLELRSGGGGVRFEGQTLLLTNCNFNNQNNTFAVDSTFERLTAIPDIDVIDCRFDGNGSGVISCLGGSLRIHNSDFTNNHPRQGIIVRAHSCNEMIVTDSRFTDNTFSALSASSCELVRISGSNFTRNGGQQRWTTGGAVALSQNRDVRVASCQFEGNFAANGGALSSSFPDSRTETHFLPLFGPNDPVTPDAYQPLVIEDCAFSGNNATATGGGLYLHDHWADVMVRRTAFIGNGSAVHGGGIHCGLMSQFRITLEDCEVTSNTAPMGGGVSGVSPPWSFQYSSPIRPAAIRLVDTRICGNSGGQVDSVVV